MSDSAADKVEKKVAYSDVLAFSHYSSSPSIDIVSPTLRAGTNVSGHAVMIGLDMDANDLQYGEGSLVSVPAIKVALGVDTALPFAGFASGTVCLRRLTPLECERLMSWPDNHTRYGLLEDGSLQAISDSARYQMCGNGVVADASEWIATHYVAAKAADGRGEV